MILLWTLVIGASRVGAIWATKIVIRKGFQTVTVVAMTTLYVEIQKSKDKKYNKKKYINKSNHAKHLMMRKEMENHELKMKKKSKNRYRKDRFDLYPFNED